MSRVTILAWGAVSALGEGEAAAPAGNPGEPATVAVARDPELVSAGLRRPFAARAAVPEGADRATWLLERALAACTEDLDRARPAWRRQRVGLLLGTSSGGMRNAERAFAAMAGGSAITDPEAATYFGPMAVASRRLGVALDPAMLVLGACASSALALGLGMRCLARGACDVVLAGGFDDVTVFVAAGFEVLRATTATPPPRPFRIGRDGMVLGEGAGVVALGLAEASPSRSIFLSGFGASSDAVHLTAPDRAGSGLARAALAALTEAGGPEVDLVSPHATATPFNDAAEARAMARAVGAQHTPPVVHPLKAQIGHTLGAAGVLETLACVDAILRGVLPAAAGSGPLDPDAPARLLDRCATGSPRTALKLASAFGGANAALVVTSDPRGEPRPVRPVYLHAVAHAEAELGIEELASATGSSVERLSRADTLVRLALSSVTRLVPSLRAEDLGRVGVVVGTALATVETNALFAARIRERGAAAAEPRRFPYTSPNAVAGECSIALGLRGPSFTVGGGLHAALEAICAATLLVESADADAMVVVAADEAGPTTHALAGPALRSGAVAILLSARRDGALARIGDVHLVRGRPASASVAPGHLALLPLLGRPLPRELACASPPDAHGVVQLDPV